MIYSVKLSEDKNEQNVNIIQLHVNIFNRGFIKLMTKYIY